MKELPDIAITSYLGHKGRLDLHREQRARLNEMFGQINILSICSGYDADSAKALKGHNCLFLKYRKFKYQKHNSTLRHLYESEKPKAMLFLDDDVLPVKMPDLKTDPISVLSKWIESPDLMPSSCVYFSSKDLIWDVYYGKREEDIVICPFSIVGWAIMIRNDHQILYDKKALFPPGYTNPICDDIAFRTQCAAEGKEVVKHQKLFFETIQPADGSTLSKNQEERRQQIQDYRKHLASVYPDVVTIKKGGQISPIWKGGKKQIKDRVRRGLIRKGKYGYVPVPKEKRSKVGLGLL